MAYIILRTDKGGYVAKAGSAHSYVNKLEDACVWDTQAGAEAEVCRGNERVVSVETLLKAMRNPR